MFADLILATPWIASFVGTDGPPWLPTYMYLHSAHLDFVNDYPFNVGWGCCGGLEVRNQEIERNCLKIGRIFRNIYLINLRDRYLQLALTLKWPKKLESSKQYDVESEVRIGKFRKIIRSFSWDFENFGYNMLAAMTQNIFRKVVMGFASHSRCNPLRLWNGPWVTDDDAYMLHKPAYLDPALDILPPSLLLLLLLLLLLISSAVATA